uniref:Serine-threonine/tyrosine-protein kinase catalytic domain-containing protein n=1 Tax=Lactuca sativa TaxID=4236 RepID=A0A9R1VTX1_LACSA|nr:hypothetical protein LSAT_V11C400218450 [Lactuca sativa]
MGNCCKTVGPERRGEVGQGIKKFDTEIVMLGRLRHPNLVSLVGYSQHEDERLLVYEYMSGGLLGEHIFVPERRGEAGQGIKEFDTEIVMLGRLRHPNLVSLVGYYQHEDERLLVYEYMSGGRLGEHIFVSEHEVLEVLRICKRC